MADFDAHDEMDIDLPDEWSGRSVFPVDLPDAGGVVRSSMLDWENRARTAETGAALLQQAADSLQQVFDQNHFGDCVEGHQLAERINDAIVAWRAKLVAQTTALVALADDCRRSGQTFEHVDETAAGNIEV
ncbi:hypothetical protein [Gordonia bronchialis]|uniref:hypothetical protein n=1 Tax=Gordonia bronchialis TaxID=2054 RepID=UPI002270CC5C|nr:hypothetical protein [Gordonia bronchialis]